MCLSKNKDYPLTELFLNRQKSFFHKNGLPGFRQASDRIRRSALESDFRLGIRGTFKELLQIVHGGAGDVIKSLVGHEGLMGGNDDIGHGDQTNQLAVSYNMAGEVLIEEAALLLINIQTCGADLLVQKAMDQILRIDQSASGGIDNGNTGLHQCDALPVNHVEGFIGQGAMEGNDIRILKQFLQFHIVQAGIGVGEFIISQNIHAEAVADLGKDLTDFTGTDNAHCLTVKVESCQALQAEVKFTGAVICLMRTAVNGQQKRHGMLSDSIGGVGRNPEHRQTAFAGTEVHIVVSCKTEITSETSTTSQEIEESLTQIDPTVKPEEVSTKRPEKPSDPIKPEAINLLHPDPLGFTKIKYDKNPILRNANEITKYALNMFIQGKYDLTFYIPRNEFYAPITVLTAGDNIRTYYLFGSYRIFNANTEDLGDPRGVTARLTITRYNVETDKQTFKAAQDYVKKHPVPNGGFKDFETEKEYMRGIHDYVANLVEYNSMGYNPHSLLQTNIYDAKQEAYNALIEHSAVCAGYAKAVALIAQTAGIDCAWIWGNESPDSSHAWNVVFPCDGSEPVVVDATWDDHYNYENPDKPLYDYFYIPVKDDFSHHADESLWSFVKYLHK